jgi:hypothetical protein
VGWVIRHLVAVGLLKRPWDRASRCIVLAMNLIGLLLHICGNLVKLSSTMLIWIELIMCRIPNQFTVPRYPFYIIVTFSCFPTKDNH